MASEFAKLRTPLTVTTVEFAKVKGISREDGNPTSEIGWPYVMGVVVILLVLRMRLDGWIATSIS
jgi:hypothetical protein